MPARGVPPRPRGASQLSRLSGDTVLTPGDFQLSMSTVPPGLGSFSRAAADGGSGLPTPKQLSTTPPPRHIGGGAPAPAEPLVSPDITPPPPRGVDGAALAALGRGRGAGAGPHGRALLVLRAAFDRADARCQGVASPAALLRALRTARADIATYCSAPEPDVAYSEAVLSRLAAAAPQPLGWDAVRGAAEQQPASSGETVAAMPARSGDMEAGSEATSDGGWYGDELAARWLRASASPRRMDTTSTQPPARALPPAPPPTPAIPVPQPRTPQPGGPPQKSAVCSPGPPPCGSAQEQHAEGEAEGSDADSPRRRLAAAEQQLQLAAAACSLFEEEAAARGELRGAEAAAAAALPSPTAEVAVGLQQGFSAAALLYTAAALGDAELVARAAARAPKDLETCTGGATPLVAAARAVAAGGQPGAVAALQALLAAGARADGRADMHGWAPIHYAAAAASTEAVRALLATQEGEANRPTARGETPLLLLLRSESGSPLERRDCCRALLHGGADPAAGGAAVSPLQLLLGTEWGAPLLRGMLQEAEPGAERVASHLRALRDGGALGPAELAAAESLVPCGAAEAAPSQPTVLRLDVGVPHGSFSAEPFRGAMAAQLGVDPACIELLSVAAQGGETEVRLCVRSGEPQRDGAAPAAADALWQFARRFQQAPAGPQTPAPIRGCSLELPRVSCEPEPLQRLLQDALRLAQSLIASLPSVSPRRGPPAESSVQLSKQPEELMGTAWEACGSVLLLAGVQQGSAAQQCALGRYVGQRLVSANGAACQDTQSVARAAAGCASVRLRFADDGPAARLADAVDTARRCAEHAAERCAAGLAPVSAAAALGFCHSAALAAAGALGRPELQELGVGGALRVARALLRLSAPFAACVPPQGVALQCPPSPPPQQGSPRRRIAQAQGEGGSPRRQASPRAPATPSVGPAQLQQLRAVLARDYGSLRGAFSALSTGGRSGSALLSLDALRTVLAQGEVDAGADAVAAALRADGQVGPLTLRDLLCMDQGRGNSPRQQSRAPAASAEGSAEQRDSERPPLPPSAVPRAPSRSSPGASQPAEGHTARPTWPVDAAGAARAVELSLRRAAAGLLRRYDLDGDGVLSEAEWRGCREALGLAPPPGSAVLRAEFRRCGAAHAEGLSEAHLVAALRADQHLLARSCSVPPVGAKATVAPGGGAPEALAGKAVRVASGPSAGGTVTVEAEGEDAQLTQGGVPLGCLQWNTECDSVVVPKSAEEPLGVVTRRHEESGGWVELSGLAPGGAAERAGLRRLLTRRVTHCGGQRVALGDDLDGLAGTGTEIELRFDAPPAAAFVEGTRVLIHSLRDSPDWNGREGVVVGTNAARGCLAVAVTPPPDVDSPAPMVTLYPQNLAPAPLLHRGSSSSSRRSAARRE
eukprot:TRINITY_DN10541_c0_g1_i3.p1 TRINITY_DN10541_c0_g1~~TRINITY_DN10541_c0_g1_i3.p1  ORF type:complete len:1423 (+),score=352.75 TRINITY_DN10541_c0_g1_i3:87-4271(+)